MLDGASPTAFDPLFFKTIATEGVLARFHRLGGQVLIAVDGTEHFRSREIHCPRCSTRRRSDGGTEYCHAFLGASIVAPGHKRVLPLPPEFIAAQNGAEKQDRERNAAKRWLARHGPAVAHLRPEFLGDDRFACQPVAAAIQHAGGNFILTVDATELSHEANDCFREMRIQIIAHHSPRRGGRRGGKQAFHKGNEILFGAGIADRAADRAGGDIEGSDQGFPPCTICSNARRSTCPGFMGRLLAARSRAWIPVISSTETVWTPCSAAADAVRYTSRMPAHFLFIKSAACPEQ